MGEGAICRAQEEHIAREGEGRAKCRVRAALQLHFGILGGSFGRLVFGSPFYAPSVGVEAIRSLPAAQRC